MNSANVDKTAPAEKDLTASPSSYLPTTSSPQLRVDRSKVKMARIQHACFVLLALALLAFTLVTAVTPRSQGEFSVEAQQFRELLDTLDEATLHEILHEHFKDKYKHGVWQEDKSAMVALHQENAEIARSLVQLAKRQAAGGNGTTVFTTMTVNTEVTTTLTSTSIPDPPVTTPPPTVVPPTTEPTVPPPTTPGDTQTPNPPATTPPVSSSSTQPPSTSSTISTSSSVSTTLSTSTTPSTSSLGTTTLTYSNTSTTSSTFSSSVIFTNTSSTSETTSSRASASGEITQSIVYTTTLADGAASVVTKVTVIGADRVSSTGTSATRTANPSLQTNIANARSHDGWVVGAAVGLAVAWGL